MRMLGDRWDGFPSDFIDWLNNVGLDLLVDGVPGVASLDRRGGIVISFDYDVIDMVTINEWISKLKANYDKVSDVVEDKWGEGLMAIWNSDREVLISVDDRGSLEFLVEGRGF